MKTCKRVLAAMLCVVMALIAISLSGFNKLDLPSLFESKSEAEEVSEDSGCCEDNVTWSFDKSTGVLNITGTGEMYNCFPEFRPWSSYDSYIKTVNVADGVTSIGDCHNLTDIYYTATREQWQKISIDPGNEELTSARIHYLDK